MLINYFKWMLSKVCGKKHIIYSSLLKTLHDAEFIYILDRDCNRAEDGIDLRRRFVYENNYVGSDVIFEMNSNPCSVLEMMVALAIRCEENIMTDPDVGNRTSLWFWDMISNLGLGNMTDDNFSFDYIDNVLSTFLYRQYKRNGEGGLFKVKYCTVDLRNVEIWYQMCWYLDDILEQGEIYES